MSGSIGNILCVAAFVIGALAQDISFALPAAGTTVTAGADMVIQIQSPVPASTDKIQGVGMAIGAGACSGPCTNSTQYLGQVLYNGPYNPQWINAAGYQYQNLTVAAPNYFDGSGQITAAYFYLDGTYATPELKFATVNIVITGASG